MTITEVLPSKSNQEQKLNNSEFSTNIINTIKNIIDQDPYNLFEIKNSILLDHETKELNTKIESLVKTNTQLKEQVEKSQTELNIIQSQNRTVIERAKSVVTK